MPAADLLDIGRHTHEIFLNLRGAHIFITGGTGFFGRWLLESFLHCTKIFSIDAHISVLTRSPEAFTQNVPHIACHPSVTLVQGDIRTLTMPTTQYSHIIHGATAASVSLDQTQPTLMYDTIVQGMERMLVCLKKQDRPTCLFVSSGAVYGTQPAYIRHMPEDETMLAQPLATYSAYAQGKRDAERLWADTGPIARCFAFVGPCLPLHGSFAIGNFLRDALHGRTIQIRGDGRPERSYLYAADLAIWLWTILAKGERGRPYNVGSEDTLSIADVASTVAQTFDPPVPVHIAQKPHPHTSRERYVPSTARAQKELGLRQTTGLSEAIHKTVRWYTELQNSP